MKALFYVSGRSERIIAPGKTAHVLVVSVSATDEPNYSPPFELFCTPEEFRDAAVGRSYMGTLELLPENGK